MLPFWFGAISSTSLELWSFRRRRGKQRQCADLSSAVATWSSSPNLIIVVRQSQGYFVMFACPSRRLFPLRLGAFVQLLSSFVKVCSLRRRGKQRESALTCRAQSPLEVQAPMPPRQTKSDNLHVVSAFSFSAQGQSEKLRRKTASQKPLRPHELSDTHSLMTFFFET